jgi:hypothetical protein
MSKKNGSTPELPEQNPMDRHVEAIMGPAPDAAPPASKPQSIKIIQPDEAEQSKSLAGAAEEANEVLRSMDPTLDGAGIEKIADDDALPVLEPAEQAEDAAAPSVPEVTDQPEPVSDQPEGTAPEPMPADDGMDDPLTEKAVDDIIAEEGDVVLAAEDAKRGSEEVELTPIKKRHQARNWLKSIWEKPAGRWGIIGGSAAIVLAIAVIPNTRYFALNTVGVRSSLSLTIIDSSNDQPLKNVQVSAAGVSGQTDSNGKIKLEHVRLGRTKLLIEKRAFAAITRDITVGWGSNPLGEFSVTAVGTQYSFTITDFMSGKPIANAEASSGEGNAHADKDGKIILTLDTSTKNDADQVTVAISADNYRTENVNLTVNNKEAQAVKLVPSRKHVFISKRSGKYDVYSVNVDGKNERKVVSGTGLERDDIVLVPHQADDVAALVATRENVRNSSGFLLSTLYVLNTDTGDLVKIDQSEQIQLIGWSSDQHLI